MAHVRALVLVLVLLGSDAWAQAATEVFIPIGRSPGVSGKTSVIGSIESIDPLIVSHHTFALDDRTIVYLDRNQLQETSAVGSPLDLVLGATVEVKPRRENERVADWIKVEVSR